MGGLRVSLDGLTLHVKDVEKSREFYGRIPGAVLLYHRPGQSALFRIGTGRLGLLQASKNFHMEFDTSDLTGMYERLLELGLQPESPPMQRPWGRTDFRLIDPDGNTIEFDQEERDEG